MAYARPERHVQARSEVIAAFREVFGRAPNLGEAQMLQAVGLLESTYGYGWRGEGVGSNNMGAIQHASRPPCPADAFETGDTRADGTPYRWCYRRYPSRHAGWVDLVRTLYVRRGREAVRVAASRGDIDQAVAEQRASGYFEAPLDRYQRGIRLRIVEIAAALDEDPAWEAGIDGSTVATAVTATVAVLGGLAYYYRERVRSWL